MSITRSRIAIVGLLLVGILSLPAVYGRAVSTSADFSLTSRVLIGLAVVLAVTDVASRLGPDWFRKVTSVLRVLGAWALSGLFINSLTVTLGLLAVSWKSAGPLNLIRSILHPVFEFLGVFGPVFFILLAGIGLVLALKRLFEVFEWSLVRSGDDAISGVGYKRQFISAIVFAALAAGLAMVATSGAAIAPAIDYLVLPLAAAAVAHMAAVIVWIFVRTPWRETVAELLWGAGLAIIAYVGLKGVEDAYLTVVNQFVLPGSPETIEKLFSMVSSLGTWVAAYFAIDALIGAFSLHMFNTRQKWFVDGVAKHPVVLRSLWRSGSTMAAVTFILVGQSGPLSLLIDIDFGALAYAAYGMIGAIVVARTLELFLPARIGVLTSSLVAWAGILVFVAHLLANMPAITQTVGAMPNLADFAHGAEPYAEAVADASWWLIGGIAVVALGNTARSLDLVTGQPGAPTLIAAVGFIGVGWASWAVADAFSVLGPGFRLAGAIVLGATFGGAMSLLATFFTQGDSSVATHLTGWFAASRFRAMNIGGFLAAYLLVLRAAIFDVFAHAAVLEWVAVALVTTYVTRRTWTLGKHLGAPGDTEAPPEAWVTHDQSVDFVEEAELSRVMDEYRSYVEGNVRSALITRLSTVMWESGRSYDDILGVVSRLLGTATEHDSFGERLIRRIPFNREPDAATSHRSTREAAFNSAIEALDESQSRSTSAARPDTDELRRLIADAEKAFVDGSEQSPLVASSCVAAWSEGVDRKSIARVVDPVATYSKPVAPWYRIGPLRRRWDAEARDFRSRTVQQLRQAMAGGG